MLSLDFDIVAAVTSGDDAIEAASRGDPDVFVLDITMPGRDGFRTARELRQRGSRAPIVFLTMHESEEFVTEAFRSGAQGYVIKTRLHVDLVSAIQRVLAGHLFLPSLRSLLAVDNNVLGHVLHFYPDERALIDGLAAFLSATLQRGDAVSMISTPPVRGNLAKRLQASGWSVGESGEFGRFRASDSKGTASSILSNSQPVPDQIADYVADLDRWRAAAAGPQSRLIVVGDVATQLLLDGNVQAAMQVERSWNEFTRSLPFLTVCSYPMTSLHDDTQVEVIPHLCAEHFVVAHAAETAYLR